MEPDVPVSAERQLEGPRKESSPETTLREVNFYRSLVLRLTHNRLAFERLCDKLGREYVFLNGYLDPADLPLWLEFVETEAFPNNQAVAELLFNHMDLLDPMDFSVGDFFRYHLSWFKAHSAWRNDPTVSYNYHANGNFPAEFDAWARQQFFDKTMVLLSNSTIEIVPGMGKSPVATEELP